MSNVELITGNLGDHLLKEIEKASTCILSSFVMQSGVAFLKDPLKAAANRRGAGNKVCTGDSCSLPNPKL
ncbi:hypothetical protein D1B31_15480 [Neobacillus notoginsengisoli]|uniref:Uncharacterized protein n=1 Tax=Neobacillus notoginsengisoli TaxID=1578198 RepID=A0A417YSB1_9BACI|nr:hypothetical protein [Neobacillus notoginsengisoli]RHW38169.1 hypothetical protein D1B31_15480 [Neobacillus notoginsengisoli]